MAVGAQVHAGGESAQHHRRLALKLAPDMVHNLHYPLYAGERVGLRLSRAQYAISRQKGIDEHDPRFRWAVNQADVILAIHAGQRPFQRRASSDGVIEQSHGRVGELQLARREVQWRIGAHRHDHFAQRHAWLHRPAQGVSDSV